MFSVIIVKTSAEKVILQIFDIFANELSLFNSIDSLCLNKVNWIEKRLNSWKKMSQICEITLSADVFTTNLSLEKHSTVPFKENELIQFHSLGAKSSALSASASSFSSGSSPPKVEFLVPETYETPPPECNGGDGSLSGITFINFLISAIAVAANLISNINSNQRNNNNNNNDNNDNVANFNFANNNNGANNQNSIQICE